MVPPASRRFYQFIQEISISSTIICAFICPAFFFSLSCLPSSVCQGLMVSEDGNQVQAHNYFPWNWFVTCVYSTPPHYHLPSHLFWSGCVPNHLDTISGCAEQAFARRLLKWLGQSLCLLNTPDSLFCNSAKTLYKLFQPISFSSSFWIRLCFKWSPVRKVCKPPVVGVGLSQPKEGVLCVPCPTGQNPVQPGEAYWDRSLRLFTL